ncbi:filamin-C-like isoform X2 [Ostrea edulis]|uniref:filamin-C-like isoform X2 n=1 Tax=Ostrea edulis TaxID=37623 RepID=UPI0024AF6E10|nr:filamin-C-like isoform X2 [Ostrea edulis]
MATFRAISREGHAAMSMRDGSDRWILIQQNTFTNWVNEQLRVSGIETTEFIKDLGTDFDTGVKLCQLVESLQGKKIGRIIKKPMNHHQQLENVTIALTAIANDNVRLVNIGPEDIVNGNLKLILGLIWHLILRYQIGKTKFPTKKLMIAWLQAVIPECGIGNFTTDWNSGIALHALIDYCRPGLYPNWRQISRSDGLNNCKNAMELAKREFDIPLVVRPEDLSSPDLDELSGMTYLSYFMKVDSPGYHATMSMVRKLLKHGNVTNFTTDWSDGRLLCNLCVSLGASVSGWPTLTGNSIENQGLGIQAAQRLGVEPILTAKEMCDPEVDHIGIMAYAAYFNRFKPIRSPAEKVVMDMQPKNCYIGIISTFTVRIEDDEVSSSGVSADLKGPDSNPPVTFSWSGRVGTASFTPTETGIHRLNVYCENQLIVGCPISFKVLADRSKVTFSSIDHCAVGMITELKVNSQYAGQGDVQVEARAPGGRVQNLHTVYRNGDYIINFTPSEVGVWQVSVHYEGDHISGSPFNIKVFDPNAVRVFGLEGGTVGMGLNFTVDTSEAGEGDLRVTVTHDYQQVPAYITHQRAGLYRADFTPEGAGTYRVNVFYNDIEVRGSPYTLDIVDSGRVTVSGDGLSLVPVNRTAKFVVDTQGSSSGKVNVEITAPSGKSVLKKIEPVGKGKFQVEYNPLETGDHQIMVHYCDQVVKGAPFFCKVYDAGQVIVSHMPSHTTVNQPVSFNIDASEAGSGNIEIMVNKGRIACNVQNLGSYKFLASFVPTKAERHNVEMKFNNLPVIGSPWQVQVTDPKSISVVGTGIDFILVNRKTNFVVNCGENMSENIYVSITGPSGQSVPCDVSSGEQGQTVEYVPTEVGDHKISIMYRDTEIEGSPFTAKAYDTSAIMVSPLQDGLVGSPVEFTIDVTRAGEGQLEIMVNDGNLRNSVDMERTGVYRITFTPQEAGRQYVNINFNSEGVPGSPLSCVAVDVAGAAITGLKTTLPANKLTAFTIETPSAGVSEFSAVVDITSPSGEKIPATVTSTPVDGQHVEFVPREVGEYTIQVFCGKDEICGGPHYVNVFNPKSVIINNMPFHCFLGEKCTFLVDASKAGGGILEVAILANMNHVPHTLEDLGKGIYEISFVGQEAVRHRVHLTFNEIYIPGSPFWIEVLDELEFVMDEFSRQQFFAIYQSAGFTFHGPSGLSDQFKVSIEGPSGKKIDAKIRESSSKSYFIEFEPLEVGSHLVQVYFNGMMLKNFPYVIKVYDADKVKVIRPDKSVVDERIKILIDVSRSGEGELEMIVECDGETLPSEMKEMERGRIEAFFIPRRAGVHKISMTFNGEKVPGSPFIVDVEGQMVKEVAIMAKPEFQKISLETRNFRINQQQWILLQAFGSSIEDFSHFQISIIAPNGNRIPARIISQADGSFKVEWTPTSTGRHTVEVQYAGRQIDGSPFYVDVFDLAMIRVEHFKQGGVGETASFDIDFSQVGIQDYSVVIRSPTGSIVDYNSISAHSDVRKEITYVPSETGQHEIYINYCGFELPGCPVMHNIEEGGLPTAAGPGLYKGQEDKEAVFSVDVGKRSGDLDIKVDGPNSIAKTTVERSGEKFIVTYTPVEVGIFNISILWNGVAIPGSPFHPKVIDPRKVRISGGWAQYMDGNERVALVVGEEKRLVFDVSQAGPGSLRAEVVGPGSTLPVSVTDNYGQTVVAFVPQDEGNHYIHLHWSDIALPNSPFLGYAVPGFADANKVILTGRGLKEATVREEADFVIDGSQAGPGAPDVTLTGVRAEINVKVVSLGGGKHRCTYIPVVPGAYLLHITWNGRQLRGSPYKVNVIGTFYPNKVTVSGEGLRGGILGRSMDVAIDTRKAGPGELTAFCMGPAKASYCELQDNHDGTFVLKVKPQEPGRHVLQIKYGGEHINGSPFVLKVGAQPDASKVRVTGPGVEHGILATYQSRFIVETRGAGAGQLTVRIRGPKGGFQVEMYRDSQRDRTILCRFDPTETGLYIVSVRWSGVDVPGSPFQINIVDTQQELEQVLHEASFSQSSVTPRSYAQWREEI